MQKELLANDGNFLTKFIALQRVHSGGQDFNISGNWVMTDCASGDKFQYFWDQTGPGTFGGQQRNIGSGKINHGLIEGDRVSWQVANIGCTGRLLSDAKLEDGSYFNKNTGKKLGTFTGERQDGPREKEEIERRRKEDEQRRLRNAEEELKKRREEEGRQAFRKAEEEQKEHNVKRARLSELLTETPKPAQFSKAVPPVPPKVMGTPSRFSYTPPTPAPPAPAPPAPAPAAPAPAAAPPAPASPAPSNSVPTGMVIWYNGRQQRGMILSDQDGKMLQIAPNGAPNVGSASPLPEGLMHGTRVTYTLNRLPVIGLVCSDVRPLDGQVALSSGGNTQVGGQAVNEDRMTIVDLPDGLGHLAGVIDGHRGVNCADFLAQRLPHAVVNSVRERFNQNEMSGSSINSLTSAEEVEVIRAGLVEAFEVCDRNFLEAAQAQRWGDGACALLALLTHGFQSLEVAKGTVPNAPGGVAKCFVAWCGTGRMLLLRGREHLNCTKEHLCSDHDENRRLQSLGALLFQDPKGIWWMGRPDQVQAAQRCQQGLEEVGPNSFLAASRGFGDLQLKEAPPNFLGERKPPILTATPEVSVLDLTPDDWGIVLAGRGVCSVLSDQDIAEICMQEMGTMRKGPIETAEVVTARAAQRGARDNLTCIVMRLGWVDAPGQMSINELLSNCEAGSPAAQQAASPAAPAVAPVVKPLAPDTGTSVSWNMSNIVPPPPPVAPGSDRPVPDAALPTSKSAALAPPPPRVVHPPKASSPFSKASGMPPPTSTAGMPPAPDAAPLGMPMSLPGLNGGIHSPALDAVLLGMPMSLPGLNGGIPSPAVGAAPFFEEVAEHIDPNKRYTGKLKSWNAKEGWGEVTLDSRFPLKEVPRNNLLFAETQINSGGKEVPELNQGLDLEFGIIQDADCGPCCVNMTLGGGLPITQAAIERRKVSCSQTFMGTIDSYNTWGYGYIKPNAPEDLPPMVRDAMQHEVEQFQKKSPKSPATLTLYFRKRDVSGFTQIKLGASCSFETYMDEKGAGACNVIMVK